MVVAWGDGAGVEHRTHRYPCEGLADQEFLVPHELRREALQPLDVGFCHWLRQRLVAAVGGVGDDALVRAQGQSNVVVPSGYARGG